jgi:ferrochelatase
MRVFYAMRQGRPSIAEALERVVALGVDDLVVVPMHSPFGGMTTRTTFTELYRQISRLSRPIDVSTRSIWHDDAGYANAQARLIHEYAMTHGLTPEDTRLVYSVRSLPATCVEEGNPYVDQVRVTTELVTRRLGWPSERTSLGYHSGPGAATWLRPTTVHVLEELSRSGERQVLVCPLGLATECPETREEIQTRYREQFERNDGRFFVCPALNTFEPFIAALKKLVLYGRRPVGSHTKNTRPAALARRHDEPGDEIEAPIDSLVMVGTSLRGRLGPNGGPDMEYAEAGQFRKIKSPQCAVPDMLRAVCEGGVVREALLWNTCRRFEFYGWLKCTMDDTERLQTILDVRRRLFDANGHTDVSAVNILQGADAWVYLMQTAAGLNSGLPGEREVLQQLYGARRLAERAGTAGPLLNKLVDEVSTHEQKLREQTEWGRFRPDYCHASISQVVRSAELDLADCRCVVIGGSTTSCSILDVLAERFGVPRRRLTLLHRGHSHGGHLKMLRRAIGNGRRVRVHKYDEESVIRAIADADVVLFGLDRKEPVLDAEQIRNCRDFTDRPLAVIDFNMFGSTVGMEALDGVRVWDAEDLEDAVAAFAEDMCRSEEFTRAAEAAEMWIRDRVPRRPAIIPSK